MLNMKYIGEHFNGSAVMVASFPHTNQRHSDVSGCSVSRETQHVHYARPSAKRLLAAAATAHAHALACRVLVLCCRDVRLRPVGIVFAFVSGVNCMCADFV